MDLEGLAILALGVVFILGQAGEHIQGQEGVCIQAQVEGYTLVLEAGCIRVLEVVCTLVLEEACILVLAVECTPGLEEVHLLAQEVDATQAPHPKMGIVVLIRLVRRGC